MLIGIESDWSFVSVNYGYFPLQTPGVMIQIFV